MLYEVITQAFITDIASQLGITESRRLLGSAVLRRDQANQRLPGVIASYNFV